MTTTLAQADPASEPPPTVHLRDVGYYLGRIHQECLTAAGAPRADVARVHLSFAAHYLRSVSSAVDRRLSDGGHGE